MRSSLVPGFALGALLASHVAIISGTALDNGTPTATGPGCVLTDIDIYHNGTLTQRYVCDPGVFATPSMSVLPGPTESAFPSSSQTPTDLCDIRLDRATLQNNNDTTFEWLTKQERRFQESESKNFQHFLIDEFAPQAGEAEKQNNFEAKYVSRV